MKLTNSNTFDFATIANFKSAQEVRPFIEYVNRVFEELIRALGQKLTLQDNFLGEVLTVQLTHNVTTNIAISRSQILGVIPLRVESVTDTLTSLATAINQNGQLVLTPQFKLASQIRLNVTLFVLFPNEA